MSKMEILAELPRLNAADRREIFDRLCEIEERDLVGGEVTPEDKTLLESEWEEYHRDPDSGAAWNEVEARIRRPRCR